MSVEPLPSGWKVVKSGSRPGMVSFINEHTKEKIGWYPTSEASKKAHNLPEETFFVSKEMLDDSNNLKLPRGWERVASVSRPGEFSYKNKYTKEKNIMDTTISSSKGKAEKCGYVGGHSENEPKRVTSSPFLSINNFKATSLTTPIFRIGGRTAESTTWESMRPKFTRRKRTHASPIHYYTYLV